MADIHNRKGKICFVAKFSIFHTENLIHAYNERYVHELFSAVNYIKIWCNKQLCKIKQRLFRAIPYFHAVCKQHFTYTDQNGSLGVTLIASAYFCNKLSYLSWKFTYENWRTWRRIKILDDIIHDIRIYSFSDMLLISTWVFLPEKRKNRTLLIEAQFICITQKHTRVKGFLNKRPKTFYNVTNYALISKGNFTNWTHL